MVSRSSFETQNTKIYVGSKNSEVFVLEKVLLPSYITKPQVES